jgi:hypothetical protein
MEIDRNRNRDRRKHVLATVLALVLLMCLPLPGRAGPHDTLTSYEGSKTCMPCHKAEVNQVFGSAHYQLRGSAAQVPNLKPKAGKLGGINDFCTYPNTNWLFQMTNLDNQQVIVGCASCHAGMGMLPSSKKTKAQLENIDCLMCHADTYKRVGQVQANNQIRFVPDPNVNIATVLSSISLPTKATCLSRCHSGAGGGNGIKQGDIDNQQLNGPTSLDVHMSPQGANLSCLNCHTARNHKIAGRGNDIRETDLNVKVKCQNCHANQHNSDPDIKRHLDRVDCTVCHIPTFAKGTPTDVLRDFSQSEPDLTAKRYEPVRTLQGNLMPAYGFWNGKSFFYKFGAPLKLKADNSFLLAGPLGSIKDNKSKLYAFKFHQGNMAYDIQKKRLIPLNSKVVWETGNMDQGILQGAAAVGWNVSAYNFATSQRYLSLHHQVGPSDSALQCNDCHGSNNRVNFSALGYDPKTTRNGKALCASCHRARNADFTEIHHIHVGGEENIKCSTCHNF